MPIASVTAKPLIGPEPNQKSSAAAIRVVRLASMMVAQRPVVAGVDGADDAAPDPRLLADALEDQHIGVHRHADGEHDAGDARQGERRLQQRERAEDQRHVEHERHIRHHAEQAVGQPHEHEHRHHADDARGLAGVDRILAEARPDGALLQIDQRGRQRAGAQQQRQVLRLRHGERAGDDAAAAQDRLADHRRADHLIVEHHRQRPADMIAGGAPELARAHRVEAEADHRLAVLEGLLRIDQPLAGDPDALLHQIVALLLLGVGSLEPAGAGRGAFRGRGVALVQQVEGELGGLRQQRLDGVGIIDARQLHDDAVGALALDGGLAQAELVQPNAQDFQRLLDGAAGHADHDFRRIGEAPGAALVQLDRHLGVALGDQRAGAFGLGRLRGARTPPPRRARRGRDSRCARRAGCGAPCPPRPPAARSAPPPSAPRSADARRPAGRGRD